MFISFAGSDFSAQYSWATDLHFDMATTNANKEWLEVAKKENSSALFLSGDITEEDSLIKELKAIQEAIEKPLFFVLGNHDFYGGSIREKREQVKEALKGNASLRYLTAEQEPIFLDHQVALIGDDGWADATSGDFLSSTISLKDYTEIDELSSISQETRFATLQRLGQEAKERLEGKLIKALESSNLVIMLVHAPPFAEACLYENRPTNDDWAPHFVSGSIGELILDVMPNFKEKKLLVLSGHTHHQAHFSPLENVDVCVGFAEYGRPAMQPIIQVTNRVLENERYSN